MKRRQVLSGSFYARPTLTVCADLIGKVLVHERDGARTSGIIIEAEAYIGEADPACHAAPGPTRRNEPLYGPPGRAYVYLNYGIHYLVNAVTEPAGQPAAVLIRALEPLEGLELMRRRRNRDRRRTARSAGRPRPAPVRDDELCRGPGNLTMALAIGPRHNRADLTAGPLRIEDHGISPPAVEWSPRIGIAVGCEMHWRSVWKMHPGVSGQQGRQGRGA